jgi:hypothetical protein
MARGFKALRRCRAEFAGSPDNLRCDVMMVEGGVHPGDHWAGSGGERVHWPESATVYPESGNDTARSDQVGGEHYRKFKIQPWDVIDEYGLGFYAGNALKYLLRAGHKDSRIQDLKKCRHYLDKLIEMEEGGSG